MTKKPLWLIAEGIRELLNLLVNRLDSAEQRGSAASQSVALTEKTWPTLHASPFESRKEELWEHVIEMCRWGWLQVKPERALTSASGYASGFKGSAKRLRMPGGCSLYYAGTGALGGEIKLRFEEWLFGSADPARPVYFWGDLDFAGMRILAAIRSTFPRLTAWEPGYVLMLQELLEGRGHSPEAAEKAGQRPIERTGCLYADQQLIPALKIQGRFVDQELFRVDSL